MNRGISFLLDPSGDFAILPGDTDLSAPTGNSDLAPSAIGGYLWDSALRAGKTVRAYGPLMDLTNFYYVPAGADPAQASPNNPLYIPIRRTPFEDGVPQAAISKTSLAGNTDLYFRGYDMNEPDIYSFEEWKRDVEAYAAENGALPNLMVVALPHDYFGRFDTALAGIRYP